MAMPAQGGHGTTPMTVKNTAFLLDRLGQDCAPLQFLRELTKNSIEAIQRTHAPGEIIWDVDWTYYDLGGIYKLSITDTGDGMTGQEMVDFINQLSSSVSEQSFTGNFGVGAKIAAATRNHAGLVYLSWKNGIGSMIHMWRDPVANTYGLKRWERSDGSGAVTEFIEIEDAVKPRIIGQNGTKITLLGNSEEEDTMKAPSGAPSASRWIAKYLNSRFFTLPETVTLKAREGWEYARKDTARNKLRTITGQKAFLDDHAAAHGAVELENATAYWWILEDTDALSQESNYYASTGHTAALFQDELYELEMGRAATARLQNFGVIFGPRYVVIYVAPQASNEHRVTANTARTHLLLNSEPLPWTAWAEEFREKMPAELADFISTKGAAAAETDHLKTIRDRLKGVMELFKISRYRPIQTGEYLVDAEWKVPGGRSSRGGTRGDIGESDGGGYGGKAGNIYSLFEKKDGNPAAKVAPDPFPVTKWVTVRDGTRELGEMEDRAARYIPEQNLLLINADFRVFADMIKRWEKDFSATAKATINDVVHGWFEQQLVETVMGVQALQSAPEWSRDSILAALSEEALTAAVMQRYHVHNSIKRELSAKLGKVQVA